MAFSRRILVVEDERDLAELLVYNLKKHGFDALALRDGHAAIAAIRTQPPDLLILDLMLPGLSGIEIARSVRTNPRLAKVPIIMLTARADEADQLAGLAVGADDYVTKPFSMKVLLARVQSLLRRTPSSEGQDARLAVGPVSADLAGHIVSVDGRDTKLTLTEFKLLTALMQAPSRVLSRNELINRVMGPGIVVTSRTIDVHIAALRKKLGYAGTMIRTIRGVGYQITESRLDLNARNAPFDNDQDPDADLALNAGADDPLDALADADPVADAQDSADASDALDPTGHNDRNGHIVHGDTGPRLPRDNERAQPDGVSRA